ARASHRSIGSAMPPIIHRSVFDCARQHFGLRGSLFFRRNCFFTRGLPNIRLAVRASRAGLSMQAPELPILLTDPFSLLAGGLRFFRFALNAEALGSRVLEHQLEPVIT